MTAPPARLRIAAMVDWIVGGGAERAAVEIAVRLAERHDVTMISSRLSPAHHDAEMFAGTVRRLADANVGLVSLGRTSTARVWQWRRLVGHLRRTRYDVLHTHLNGSNFWGPTLRATGGVGAWVAHEQTPFAREGGVRAHGAEALVNPFVVGPFADRVIVPSAWSKRSLVTNERVPAGKIRVVPNAAPATMPQPSDDRRAVRASMGVHDDAPVILIAAMLRPEKGHEVAVDALARVREHHPRAVLVLAGEGEVHDKVGTRPAIERRARALGVADAVRFLGRRHDVMDLLGGADVALLSSHHENLPLALLEYMESGTPIVTTDAGGNRELVVDGEHGLVVPAGDAAAMAAAVVRTLDAPAAAAARARAAQARRRRVFTWDAVARDVEDVYLEALGA
ncbi:glycosyltransferase [Patulibacter sp. SYSU D01012]|uniref:glycosyltransferase n=1 Tax=Patulibacter sp. SYSU D01012 TaxID=2817381 RepID=UPI001B3121AA|nr:glycosyltransferase [Patulibacter sp. SYSU D01012]